MHKPPFRQQIIGFSLAILLLVGCGEAPVVAPTTVPTQVPTPTAQPTPIPQAKRALFVIFSLFEESEYGVPRAILEDKGVLISVASSSLKLVSGAGKTKVQPDLMLSDVQTADYDVIVFVGGYRYESANAEAIRVAQEAASQGKLLAAICIAPTTLARAGVLKGKRATTSMPGSALEAEGAIYTGALVERDGLIITANGPAASRAFGEAIANALEE